MKKPMKLTSSNYVIDHFDAFDTLISTVLGVPDYAMIRIHFASRARRDRFLEEIPGATLEEEPKPHLSFGPNGELELYLSYGPNSVSTEQVWREMWGMQPTPRCANDAFLELGDAFCGLGGSLTRALSIEKMLDFLARVLRRW